MQIIHAITITDAAFTFSSLDGLSHLWHTEADVCFTNSLLEHGDI